MPRRPCDPFKPNVSMEKRRWPGHHTFEQAADGAHSPHRSPYRFYCQSVIGGVARKNCFNRIELQANKMSPAIRFTDTF